VPDGGKADSGVPSRKLANELPVLLKLTPSLVELLLKLKLPPQSWAFVVVLVGAAYLKSRN